MKGQAKTLTLMESPGKTEPLNSTQGHVDVLTSVEESPPTAETCGHKLTMCKPAKDSAQSTKRQAKIQKVRKSFKERFHKNFKFLCTPNYRGKTHLKQPNAE